MGILATLSEHLMVLYKINYLSYGLAKWTDFLLLVAEKGIPRIG